MPVFEEVSFPHDAADFFHPTHLEIFFRSKIAKSQATGLDGVRIGAFHQNLAHEVQHISKKVLAGDYKFTSYKERLILRGADRCPRQISIPTVRDRLTLRAVCELLHGHVPCANASSPHALVKAVVQEIRRDAGPRSFVRIDVRDFFPTVQHDLLLKAVEKHGLPPFISDIVAKAVSNSTGPVGTPNRQGIPQGLSISTELSAIFMEEFDLSEKAKEGVYFRYVDDILIICPSQLASRRMKDAVIALEQLGLKAHPLGSVGKTEIKSIKDGIEFLGYDISIGKVSVRRSSYNRMFRNLLKIITDFRYRKDGDKAIFRLNLKITGCLVDGKRRGWLMFFSQTENLSQLKYLDRFVMNQLRRVGLSQAKFGQVKSFVKSYHQIRHKLFTTDYIPNFDTYTLEQKREAILTLSNVKPEILDTWSLESLEEEFSRLVAREISELEADLGSMS